VRKVVSPSFQITNGIGFGEDPYPPTRITDLRVERTLDSTSELKLSWTSPGGDFDKGKGTIDPRIHESQICGKEISQMKY